MKTLAARLLQICGILTICACVTAGTNFLTRADDVRPSAPKYGDLQHLTFTATGTLPVTILAPADGSAVSGVATEVSAKTVNGAGVELQINGDVVPARSLGRMSVAKDGFTQYDFYGVLLHPGPNTIVATALGANGVRGMSATETIFGPGPATSVRLSMMGSLVADGRSQARLIVDALDQWNHPAMPGAEVHVSILQGRATIGDASGQAPATPSAIPTTVPVSASAQPEQHYELAQGGRIAIPIIASLEPGTLQVQVSIGAIADTEAFTIAPYLRAPFVNGVVSVGAGSVPAAVDGDGRYDAGGSRKARIAIFGSGKVGRASSLTFSYESQNRLQQSSVYGPYVQNPNERPYQTYGDSSTVASDFHSNDRLYARVDNGRNNVMWGQYDTTVGDPQGVAHYRQQLSGIKGEVALGATGQGRLVGFSARNLTSFVSFTVPVTGLAALLQPLHPNILVGSDILTLVALDRRSGAVSSQTLLVRNVDYTVDYATGVVRFLNIPLPFDRNFNPQVLYVQYQYQGPGVHSETTGVDLQYALNRKHSAQVDIGYMNDTTGLANYTLATQSVSGRTATGEWRLSHGSSAGVVPTANAFGNAGGATSGSATAFTMNERLAGSEFALSYQNVGPGFANPFGGFTVNGLESMGATLAHQTKHHGSFTLAFGQQRNTGGGASSLQQTMVASWQSLISNALSFSLGLQAQRQTNAPAAGVQGVVPAQAITGSAAQLQAGFRWKPASRMELAVQHQASLGGNSQVLPSQTAGEFDYDFPKQGKFYLRELLGGSIASFASSTSPYMGAAQSSHSTQFGFERSLGSATVVDSSYLINDTGNATNVYTTLGVQETFKFGKRLAGNASFQSAQATGGGTSGFNVFGAGFTYSDLKDFRASLTAQTRGGFAGGSTLSGGATGHIGPNIALLGAFNETFGNGISAVDDRISLAFRPQQNDRFISLLALDRQVGGYSGLAGGAADVLSFDEIYRPTESTEIAARLGYKLNGDGYYMAHSSVAGLRFTQALGPHFDIAAEGREMAAGNIAAASATDLAAELGYNVPGGARIAAGYNFSGSVDPTLTGHPQRRGFYVTVTTVVDRIFGWGKP